MRKDKKKLIKKTLKFLNKHLTLKIKKPIKVKDKKRGKYLIIAEFGDRYSLEDPRSTVKDLEKQIKCLDGTPYFIEFCSNNSVNFRKNKNN